MDKVRASHHLVALLKRGIAAALCLVFAGLCRAATLYEINPWILPPGVVRYPPINATCGDALQFVWSQAEGAHGVFRLSPDNNGTCPSTWDNSTGMELAAVTVGGNITYITKNEMSFWVACPAANGSHCNLGQMIHINMTCPPAAAANLTTMDTVPSLTAAAAGGAPRGGAVVLPVEVLPTNGGYGAGGTYAGTYGYGGGHGGGYGNM